jgi:hypothetical protein
VVHPTDRIMAMCYHFPFSAIGHVVRYDTALGNAPRSSPAPIRNNWLAKHTDDGRRAE